MIVTAFVSKTAGGIPPDDPAHVPRHRAASHVLERRRHLLPGSITSLPLDIVSGPVVRPTRAIVESTPRVGPVRHLRR